VLPFLLPIFPSHYSQFLLFKFTIPNPYFNYRSRPLLPIHPLYLFPPHFPSPLFSHFQSISPLLLTHSHRPHLLPPPPPQMPSGIYPSICPLFSPSPSTNSLPKRPPISFRFLPFPPFHLPPTSTPIPARALPIILLTIFDPQTRSRPSPN